MFQLAVREAALAGGVTVSYKGRTIVASTDQPMASVNGRVGPLPAPVARIGRRLFVPIDFIARALAPVYDSPIDLRRASRLLVVGAIRVARVVVSIDAAGPPTRASVEVTPALLVSSMFDAGRVIVRVEADMLDPAPPPAPAGLIDQIQAGNQTTTIAFALSTRAGIPRVSTTTTTESTRVTIEIPPGAQPQDTSAAPPPQPGPPPLAAVPPAPPAADAVPALPGQRTAKLQTMVIDPGHGGDDAGVRGPRGALEKQVTLEVARRLKTLIETRLGVRVILTREEDRAVSPDERDAIANNNKADLFLSVHVNGAPSPAMKGAQVYYLRLDRADEDARLRTAASELVLPAGGGHRGHLRRGRVGCVAAARADGVPRPGATERAGARGPRGQRAAHHRDAVLRNARRPGARRRQARGAARRGAARAGPPDSGERARGGAAAVRVAHPAGDDAARVLRHRPRRCVRRPEPRGLDDASGRIDQRAVDGLCDCQHRDGQPVVGRARADSHRRQAGGHARRPRRSPGPVPPRHVAGAGGQGNAVIALQ